jgi:hypothetical protein
MVKLYRANVELRRVLTSRGAGTTSKFERIARQVFEACLDGSIKLLLTLAGWMQGVASKHAAT